jgi:hypothetical protein
MQLGGNDLRPDSPISIVVHDTSLSPWCRVCLDYSVFIQEDEEAKKVVSSTSSTPALWPPSLIYDAYDGWTVSSGVKLPGRQANHSPPTSTEINKTRAYTSTPYVSMSQCLISLAQGLKLN